ncbi:MAG: MATE family efflux transporter [Gorillibacterium sp.]|nr:MATE family efflux transporter [Gorillibacterium sp.]
MKNWKVILALALPSLLAFASSTLTGTINLIMIGKMGAIAIGAVGVSNIIMYNAWALCSGFGHTINYLVAQNHGSGEMKKGVERTYVALYNGVILGVLLVIAGILAPEAILHLTGGSSELIAAGVPYLRIRLFALSMGIISFILQGFMRGVGDTRTPMILSLSSNVAMIFFTYTLTYGHWGFPELGLSGAAWGIFFGDVIALAGSIYVYFFRMNPEFATRVRAKFNKLEVKLILTESGKLGIQEFAMSLAMLVFTAFVARISDQALAANEVALNVMSLGFMPAFAFGSTATILVGREIGRGNPLQARRFGTETAIIGTIMLLILGTVEFIFADKIAMIYNASDSGVFELAADLIKISAFLQLFDGLFNMYGGCLRGLGDTSFLVKASFGLSWLIFVPLAYLLTFVFDMHSVGAWIGLYTFITLYGIAVTIRFYRTDWQSVSVKQVAVGPGE